MMKRRGKTILEELKQAKEEFLKAYRNGSFLPLFFN